MNALLSKHQQNKMTDFSLQFKSVQNLTEYSIRVFHLVIECYNS